MLVANTLNCSSKSFETSQTNGLEARRRLVSAYKLRVRQRQTTSPILCENQTLTPLFGVSSRHHSDWAQFALDGIDDRVTRQPSCGLEEEDPTSAVKGTRKGGTRGHQRKANAHGVEGHRGKCGKLGHSVQSCQSVLEETRVDVHSMMVAHKFGGIFTLLRARSGGRGCVRSHEQFVAERC